MDDEPVSTIEVIAINDTDVHLRVTLPDEGYGDPVQNVTRSFVLQALDAILSTREDEKAALVDALFDVGDTTPDWAEDAYWMETHLDAYVTSVRVEQSDDPHRYSLHARIADPRWLEGLEVGMQAETWAYDTFFE